MKTVSEPLEVERVMLVVNGKESTLELDSRTTLAEALREHMGLTGTKIGCNRAECGSCTVLLDGKPVYSCTTLAVECNGKKVETIEGLSKDGQLNPLQELFIDDDALQCGYCIPGIVMSLKALLDKGGKFGREDVRLALAGNYCRCGAYPNMEKVTLAFSGK